MKKLTLEQAWGCGGLMAVSAVRYCLGRRTYIVSDCKEWLCEIWDKLPEKAKAIIRALAGHPAGLWQLTLEFFGWYEKECMA